jgi:dTMP kinase
VEKKSVLITFEGGDGVGKTTLIKKIHEYFVYQKKEVLLTRAPGGTKVGETLRNLLLHGDKKLSPQAELFLFLADRAQHVDEIIQPALKAGKIVLCDRFNDSTVAYQGGARGFGLNFVNNLCLFATQNLEPIITLYLDIDPLEGLRRAGKVKDRIEQEDLAFHQKIRATYLEIAKKQPDRFFLIDATLSVEEVFFQAKKAISFHLENQINSYQQ